MQGAGDRVDRLRHDAIVHAHPAALLGYEPGAFELGMAELRKRLVRHVADADVEAAIARQRRFDPDLWVIEVEDRQGRTLLDEPGLAE